MNLIQKSTKTKNGIRTSPLPDRAIEILKYFNDQNEDNRFNIPKEVWAKTTALLKKYNLSLGINGAVFDRSRIGIIPSLVKKIYFDRKASKKKMLKYEQQAEKIKAILNS